MSTHVSKKVGKLARTKGTTVTTTVRKEVQDAASATIVAGAAVGLPPAGAGTSPPIAGAAGAAGATGTDQGPAVHAGNANPTGETAVGALTGAGSAVASWRATLGPFLVALAKGQAPHLGHSPGAIVQAADAIVRLLRVVPTLSGTVDPAELESVTAQVHAGLALEAALDLLLGEVKDSNRMNLDTIWLQSRDVYHAGNRAARTDREIATAIAPVQVLFQRTPKATVAPMAAADQTRRATLAANRAAKAAQKATTAHHRAAALAPPGLPQPTPGPGVDQGPAHTTADSSATPVTPGTSPSR